VDLEILTPLTDQGEHPVMLLEEVFAPQRVRADPPPVEVPREVWRRLAAAGHDDGTCDLPEQVDREKLEAALRAYHDRPAKPVLDVIADPGGRKLVVLGDPGAGKSTLSRYLMLALAGPGGVGQAGRGGSRWGGWPGWAAGWLPLLVELRTYTDPGWRNGRAVTFLDLIDHLHATQDVGLPRRLLEPFLDGGGAALVVFDGLDEVFDPHQREQVTAEIEGFAARYPKTRVVVTSRVVGYRRGMLDAAGFTHWMLQDLDPDQIRAFTTDWYTRSCLTDPVQAARLTDRLMDAVDASAAVAELAGNPMLLTILAIIGRRRELPRDRRSVYEHAVAVLVEHWDVNKHLRDVDGTGTAFLDATDKLELLHQVARSMQAAPAGLAGNHIPGPDLVEQFRSYLERELQFAPDRSVPAARAMLAQFRERNFILARFGSEVYGFVHRAFLEYLAADDINRRLTNLDLTHEELFAVYDQHWNDPAWAEVLLLLTGMIPDRLAVTVIIRLLDTDPRWRVRPGLPRHLLLALQAVAEIRKPVVLAPQATAITTALTALLEETATRQDRQNTRFAFLPVGVLPDSVEAVTARLILVLGPTWPARDQYHRWFHTRGQHLPATYPYVVARAAAQILLAQQPNTPTQLRQSATHPNWAVQGAAVQAIAAGWADDPGTLPLLRDRATTDNNWAVRRAAVQAIAGGWADDPGTLPWLRDRATTDNHDDVRQAAVQAIAPGGPTTGTLPWLRTAPPPTTTSYVREAAVQAIIAGWADDPEHPATATRPRHHRQQQRRAAGSGRRSRPGGPTTRAPCHAARPRHHRRPLGRAARGGAGDRGQVGRRPGHPAVRDRATTDNTDVRRQRCRRSRPGGPTTRSTLPWLRDRATTDNNDAVAACGGAGDRGRVGRRPGHPALYATAPPTTATPCGGSGAGDHDRVDRRPGTLPCYATAPPPTTTTPCGGRRCGDRGRVGHDPGTLPCYASAPPPTTTKTYGKRRCRRSRPGGPATRHPATATRPRHHRQQRDVRQAAVQAIAAG
jgi:hypothetical protein